MFRAVKRLFGFACLTSDILSIIVSFFCAYLIRANVLPLIPYFKERVFFPFEQYIPVGLLSSFFLLVTLFLLKGYKQNPGVALHQTFILLLKSVFLSFFLTLSGIFLLKLLYVSRTFVSLFFISYLFIGTFSRHLVSLRYRSSLRRGLQSRNLVVIGCSKVTKELLSELKSDSETGFSIRGFFLPSDDEPEGELEDIRSLGIEFLGNIFELPNFLEREVVDAVVIAEDMQKIKNIEEIFILCEELGVELAMSMKIFPHINTPIYFEKLGDIPLLHFAMTPKASFQLFLKRLIDIVLSFFGILILSPLFILVSILIKVTSEGPIFFIQERMGLRGRRFNLYKFRTMVKDAEKKLEEIKHLNEVDGPVFKIEKDPRLTPIGGFLRKSSIDELPQLFNVLKGEMSIVGPRPPIPSEVNEYERWQRRRLSMRPGLTCLWQISGRSELDFDTWMRLDLQYIDNWSLTLDLIIILKTIPAVLSGRGAK